MTARVTKLYGIHHDERINLEGLKRQNPVLKVGERREKTAILNIM